MSPAAQRRDDEHLIERARIAYFAAGGTDQPSDASDVLEVDGVTTITLRNCNGLLALYRLGAAKLKRALIVTEGGRA